MLLPVNVNFKAPIINNCLGLLFLLLFQVGYAQKLSPNFSVQAFENGTPIQIPFLGGWINPQFSQADYNFDGKTDLFVFDRSNQRYFWLEQVEEGYKIGELVQSLPISDWALLRDYNCDSIADLFYGDLGRISVITGAKVNGVLSFSGVPRNLESFYNLSTQSFIAPIFVNPIDIPLIEDSDGDGDLDIYSVSSTGVRVEHHKNLSVENLGYCDFNFEIVTGCYGYFLEDGENGRLTLGIEKCPLTVNGRSGLKHSGSTLARDPSNGNLIFGELEYDTLTSIQFTADINQMDSAISSASFPNNPALNFGDFYALYNNSNSEKLKLLAAANDFSGVKNGKQVFELEETNGSWSISDSNFLGNQYLDYGINPISFSANSGNEQVLFILANKADTLSSLHLIRKTDDGIESETLDCDLSDLKELDFIALCASLSTQNIYSLNSSGEIKLVGNSANECPFSNIPNELIASNNKTEVYSFVSTDFNRDGQDDFIVSHTNGELGLFISTPTSYDFIQPEWALNLLEEFGLSNKRVSLQIQRGKGRNLLWVSTVNGLNIVKELTSDPPYTFNAYATVEGSSYLGRNYNLAFLEGLQIATLFTGGLVPLEINGNLNFGESDLVVFPNPTENKISFSGITITSVELFSLDGKLLETFGADALQNQELELNLNPGVYILQCRSKTNTKPISKRVIINP